MKILPVLFVVDDDLNNFVVDDDESNLDMMIAKDLNNSVSANKDMVTSYSYSENL